MKKKRPIFLLEALIALGLLGMFAFYVLNSSIHYLYQETQFLLDLEFERFIDLKRMDILTKYYQDIQNRRSISEQEDVFENGLPSAQIGKKRYSRNHLLKIKVNDVHPFYELKCFEEYQRSGKRFQRTYHFFVKAEEANK